MNAAGRRVFRVMLFSGLLLLAASMYCFLNAYRIKQLLIERAGGDIFAMVLTDDPGSETDITGPNAEMWILNRRRRANDNAGRILVAGGLILSSAGAIVLARTRRPQTLGISD